MARIVSEMKYLPPEIVGRRFGIHVTSAQEIPVKAENAPDQGQGVVKYTATNPYDVPVAFVLYRGVAGLAPPYYFGNAFYCFKPDELLLGDNKPISEYRPGDMVLGIDGPVKVDAVGVRWVTNSEGMIRIKADGMLPLEVTPNHPVLAVRNINNKGGVKIVGFTEPKWVPAYKLEPKRTDREGMYLVVSIPKGNTDIKELPIDKYCSPKYLNRTINTSIPLNTDTAWLMGLYCAEGWVDGRDMNRFNLILGQDEVELIERATNIISGLGYAVRVTKLRHAKAVVITGSSRVFAKALNDWMGHGAHNKKIPDFILYHKNLNILKAFIDGLVAGDGCIVSGKQNYMSLATVSHILAMQAQLAWFRLGKFASIYVWQGASQPNRMGIRSGKQYRLRVFSKRQVHARFMGDYAYIPIRKVEHIEYEGPVYDLQTENHTIVASNVVTHNSVYLSSINGEPPVAYWYTEPDLRAPTPSSPDGAYALGVIDAGNGRDVVAFIFVVPPSSSLSFYEGGIPDASQLIDMHAYIVGIRQAEFCIHYSKAAVTQYMAQTGYTVSGLPPNPFTHASVLMTPREPNYPTNEIMPGQYATVGACAPTQTDRCHEFLESAEGEIEKGDIAKALDDLLNALRCYMAHKL